MRALKWAAQATKRVWQSIAKIVRSAPKPKSPPTYHIPSDIVLYIAMILKTTRQHRSLANLRSTSVELFDLLTPVLLETVHDPRAAEKILGMLNTIRPSRFEVRARHIVSGTTEETTRAAYRLALLPTLVRVQRLTLDLPAFESFCRVYDSYPLDKRRRVPPTLMPRLRHLTVRYNELDPGRLKSWYPVMEGRRRPAHWNPIAKEFDSFRDDESYVQVRLQQQAAAVLSAKKVCIVPDPAVYDPPDQTSLIANQWRRLRVSTELTRCPFVADFATIHNMHRYPCSVPNAKVVRIIFLSETDSSTTKAYVHPPNNGVVVPLKYIERLTTIRVMLCHLGANVSKIIFVGPERGVEPAATGDITKKQFYSKIRKAINKARSRKRMLPDGTYEEVRVKRKLKYVILDGKGGKSKTCPDCGTTM